jgi:hypothetical protein
MIKIPTSAILSLAVLSVAACKSISQKNNQPSTTMQVSKAARFACLPDDVKPDYIVSYGKKNVKVEERLEAMNAECENGKLVDGNKREIRFFKISCFGNPPHNYDEIRLREQAEIEKLKQNYTVIVIECNPMIM